MLYKCHHSNCLHGSFQTTEKPSEKTTVLNIVLIIYCVILLNLPSDFPKNRANNYHKTKLIILWIEIIIGQNPHGYTLTCYAGNCTSKCKITLFLRTVTFVKTVLSIIRICTPMGTFCTIVSQGTTCRTNSDLVIRKKRSFLRQKVYVMHQDYEWIYNVTKCGIFVTHEYRTAFVIFISSK